MNWMGTLKVCFNTPCVTTRQRACQIYMHFFGALY
uniref:Uncharacterized protein n=1 Tax=Anguilla anguilla TaxID=7936 RepID=A0A0E9WHV5_ANGAN